MTTEYSIEPITPARLKNDIDTFLAIASDIPHENWTVDNYLYDLPEKWIRSICIKHFESTKVVGFVIISRKTTHYHIHKFAIHPSFRSKGLGLKLLQYIEHNIRKSIGPKEIGLFVNNSNAKAIRFYITTGFNFISQDAHMSYYEKTLK